MATMSIHIDDSLKEQFSRFCENVGMSVSTAFTLYAKIVVHEQAIPFQIKYDDPFYSKENLAELKESIAQDKADRS